MVLVTAMGPRMFRPGQTADQRNERWDGVELETISHTHRIQGGCRCHRRPVHPTTTRIMALPPAAVERQKDCSRDPNDERAQDRHHGQ